MRIRWFRSFGLVLLLGVPACGDADAPDPFQTVRFEVQISDDLLVDVEGGRVYYYAYSANALSEPATAVPSHSDGSPIASALRPGVMRLMRGMTAADFSAHLVSPANEQVASCVLVNYPLSGTGVTHISCVATSVNPGVQAVTVTVTGETGGYLIIDPAAVSAGNVDAMTPGGPLDCAAPRPQAQFVFTHQDPDGDPAKLTVIKTGDSEYFELNLGYGFQTLDGVFKDDLPIEADESRTVTATWNGSQTTDQRVTFWAQNPDNPTGPGGIFSIDFFCASSGAVVTRHTRGLQYATTTTSQAIWVTVDPATPTSYYLDCAYDNDGFGGWARQAPIVRPSRTFLGLLHNGEGRFTVIEHNPADQGGSPFAANASYPLDCRP
jgi:hypothetical protein